VFHDEVAQVDALHLYKISQLLPRELLRLIRHRLNLHLAHLLLSSQFQLVVEVLDGVLGLEGDLEELFPECVPESGGEYLPVVESVADYILHLFFKDAVELLVGVIDYLFL
jgi:hypothetical protein